MGGKRAGKDAGISVGRVRVVGMGLFSRKKSDRPTEPDYGVYLTEVQGSVAAAIIVDLALHEVAPIKKLPYCFALHVPYEVETESGLPTEEQLEQLTGVEATVLDVADETIPHRHAATVTAEGNRNILLYVPSQASLAAFTDRLIARLGEQAPALGFTEYEDAAWETYFEDVYPNPQQLAEIRSR